MSQYLFQLFVTFLLISGAVSELPAEPCPACGGKLTRVGAVTDDPAKPSKNVCVWNRSICANLSYSDASRICTRCWLAYSEQLHRWERGSFVPDSFHRPLSAAIRGVPLPSGNNLKTGAVYYQRFTDGQITEMVAFWCSHLSETLDPLRAYARKHNLIFTADEPGRLQNQTWVRLETKPNA